MKSIKYVGCITHIHEISKICENQQYHNNSFTVDISQCQHNYLSTGTNRI